MPAHGAHDLQAEPALKPPETPLAKVVWTPRGPARRPGTTLGNLRGSSVPEPLPPESCGLN
ncbi:hypothetical protein GQ53DRAFT_428781 [Thozetella sp. PMI_491]|nr:hypothetical protein GQ53DRAFT_428781 [Thozetella sp. PMI_491]